MKRKSIIFTKPYTAEYLEEEVPLLYAENVLVKMEYTVVSGGTERACPKQCRKHWTVHHIWGEFRF